jgi:hypothetical protein
VTPPITATPTRTPTRTPTTTPTRTRTSTPTIPVSGTAIAGVVVHAGTGAVVTGVTVGLQGPAPANQVNDATGQYAFNNLASGNWSVVPRKLGGDNGAFSAFDASLILRADAGLQPITNQMQFLACDVNGDDTLDITDAILIVNRRIGLISQFPVATACNSDWTFFPVPTPAPNSSSTIPNPGPGACVEGRIAYSPLSGQARGQAFAAILFGDCSGSWKP